MKSIKVDGVTVRFRSRFVSPYEQYADRIGQRFVVTGLAPEADYDREEVGRMWSIRFGDGYETTAWPEEVERDCLVNGQRWPAWRPAASF